MGVLDRFLMPIIRAAGAAMPVRQALNFIGATVADNPATGAIDVTVIAYSPIVNKVAGSYTPTFSECRGVWFVNTSAGVVNINLPTPTSDGQVFTVKDTDNASANNITIHPADGGNTFTISADYGCKSFLSIGSQWVALSTNA